MREERVEYFIQKAAGIYTLLKYNDIPEADGLVILFKELMEIIVSGTQLQLEDFTRRAFDLNIPVSPDDVLGGRIKSFINQYLNEI